MPDSFYHHIPNNSKGHQLFSPDSPQGGTTQNHKIIITIMKKTLTREGETTDKYDSMERERGKCGTMAVMVMVADLVVVVATGERQREVFGGRRSND